MGSIQLFHVIYGDAHELAERPFSKERGLQELFEAHLRSLTGIDFLASEYSTGKLHQRRIDTLGIDAGGRPVVIEYKRSRDQNVINQGLHYLDWLEDHQAEFRELVREKLGNDRSGNVDFSSAGLLCVAGDFPDQDRSAAKNNRRRIGLLRYRRYEEVYIALEWIFGEESFTRARDKDVLPRKKPQIETAPKVVEPQQPSEEPDYSKYQRWEQLKADAELYSLFEGLCEYGRSLGDDFSVNPTNSYISLKRKRTVAYIKMPQTGNKRLLVEVRADLKGTPLVEGFTRRRSSYNDAPFNVEVTIASHDDLERAKPLIKRSYDEAG